MQYWLKFHPKAVWGWIAKLDEYLIKKEEESYKKKGKRHELCETRKKIFDTYGINPKEKMDKYCKK